MNNKIIGFTVSKQEIDHSDIDIFGVGLKLRRFRADCFTVYIWGINDFDACFLSEDSFSLSFPVHNSLLDRNVLVKWSEGAIYIENDWLGSIPVFYNAETNVISTLINKVIDPTKIELDPEGFNLYLDIGYSAFETTPVKNVKFLRYYSKLTLSNDGLSLQHKEDPAPALLDNESCPEKILESMENYIAAAEKRISGNIIIPTSGGFDSRLLNILIGDKKKIKSFTYGISKKQSESIETVKAKKLSEVFSIQWKQIELGKFNSYTKEWFSIFGPSTHLHGMYHIEFYKKIKNSEKTTGTLLSGIIGDAWSGNVSIDEINSPEKITALGYSHGINFDSKYSLLKKASTATNEFFNENSELLKSGKMRIVMSMRFKLVLLSYLVTIPEFFGYPSWSPFLNMETALGMLNISEEEKQGRKWQSDYFRKFGLDLESMDLAFSKENSLNYESIRTTPIDILDVDVLSPYVKKKELERINKKYLTLSKGQNRSGSLNEKLGKLRIVTGLKRRLKLNMNFLKPYYDILILKSIEILIKQK